ncbi:MAG: beta-ketoacyl synthase [Betaproteobacteria bacterium]|nr:beta-ketoacyl synthase [Betaproteobacteria bacterium]
MAPGIEVCPVRLPGRESRLLERPYTDVLALVTALREALDSFLDTPFAFYGHSMGALIAYELACALSAERGIAPTHLFVSAHRAPHLPNRSRRVHSLPKAELLQELRALDGISEEVLAHTELLELLLPTVRADFTLVETYVHTASAPLDCPITAFGAASDPRVSTEEMADWRAVTRGPFDMQVFPGGHFYIRDGSKPFLDVISARLGA